jgi:hypothetical protein
MANANPKYGVFGVVTAGSHPHRPSIWRMVLRRVWSGENRQEFLVLLKAQRPQMNIDSDRAPTFFPTGLYG